MTTFDPQQAGIGSAATTVAGDVSGTLGATVVDKVAGSTPSANGVSWISAANYAAMLALLASSSAAFAGVTNTGAQVLSGELTPTQIAANTNNYNPTGLSTAFRLRISSDAARDLTGIAAPAVGRLLILDNVGAFPITLKHDATSTAANRFSLGGADAILAAGASVPLIYDATTARWRTFTLRDALTLAGTTPGAGGLAVLAKTTQQAVADYLAGSSLAPAALEVTGDATFDGNIIVKGDVVPLNVELAKSADPYLGLNTEYTPVVAFPGGLVLNYLPIATNDTVAAGGFTAGVAGVSNPTIATTGAATFAAGQLVQITGATVKANNGWYEVLSHAASVLTLKGIGNTATVEGFTQNQLVTSPAVAGTITRVTLTVLRAGTDGLWEVGSGSTTPLTYADVVKTTDSRLSDSRAPTGAAGGDLSGTFPNPTVSKVAGVTAGGIGSPIPTIYSQTADENESANSLVASTYLTFTPAANGVYAGMFILPHTTAVATTGFQYTVAGPTNDAFDVFNGHVELSTSSEGQQINVFGQVASGTGIASSLAGLAFGFFGMVAGAVPDANVAIKFRTEINTSQVTLKKGAILLVWRIA